MSRTRVGAEGPLDAKIAIVGEGPGVQEVRTGRPFVGDAGKELDRLLQAAGLSRRETYITNATKYLPPKGKAKETAFFSNGSPTSFLMEGILELREELVKVQPNVVVALGNISMWALTQHDGITKWRGSILESTLIPGLKVIPSLHPAYYIYKMYAMSHKSALGVWDLMRAAKEAQFPEIRRPDVDYITSPNSLEMEEAKERLLSGDHITFDTEWYSPESMAYIGFTNDKDWALTIPYISLEHKQVMQEILGSDVPKWLQNAMFDVVAVHRIGLDVKRIEHDSMVAFHSCWMDLREKGLQTLCSVYTDHPYYKDELEFVGRDDERGQVYCGTDCVVTDESMVKIRDKDLPYTKGGRGYEISMGLMDIFLEASKFGIRCDLPLLRKRQQEYIEQAEGIEAQINDIVGYEINPRSPKQVQHLVFDVIGITGRKRSSAQDVLMDIAASTDDEGQKLLLTAFIRARQNRNRVSRYFNEDVVDKDGRLRCTWNVAGTRNGRLSTTEAWWNSVPIQTMPSEAREYCIPDPGHVFVGFDYEQAEARIVAIKCNDLNLLDDMAAGIDIHTKLASQLPFGLSYEELIEKIQEALRAGKSKDDVHERYLAKTCRHALNYIMGVTTFKGTINREYLDTGIGVTYADARELRAAYLRLHPGLKIWWNDVKNHVRRYGYMSNAWGRHRKFLGRFSDALWRDAVAFYPQSSIADLTSLSLIDIRKEAPQWKILTHMHDGAMMQVPEKEVDDAIALIKEKTIRPMDIGMATLTVPVEIKVGENWMHMK